MLRLNDYHCDECGETREVIAHEDEIVYCGPCTNQMRKLPPVFRINMGPVPIGGYYDDNLQTYIRNKAHRQEVMDRQVVSERGATPKNGTVWV